MHYRYAAADKKRAIVRRRENGMIHSQRIVGYDVEKMERIRHGLLLKFKSGVWYEIQEIMSEIYYQARAQ